MIEYQAEITCDRCGDSQSLSLDGIGTIKNEAISMAERFGWECDEEDLCPNCVAVGEWEED